MTFISQYGPAELITANFVAATAVPVVIGDAQLTFDQLKVQPRFEQSIMDLVAVGAGASTAIVQPWLWDSQLKVWFKAGVGVNGIPGPLNAGAAITGTGGFSWAEPIYRVNTGQAIYLQATSPANITTIAAYIRQRLS